jgi:hypothetical protein
MISFRRLLLLISLVGVLLILAAESSVAQYSGAAIQLHYATFDPLLDGEPAVPEGLRAQTDSAHVLIQFHGPIQAEWRSELQAAGVIFYEYIPQFAYTARITQDNQTEVAAHPAVRWVGSLHPAYKLSPTLSGGRLLLKVYPGADEAVVAQAATEAGAVLVAENPDADLLILEAGASLAQALAAIPEVSWVQDVIRLQEMNDDARWVSQSNVPFKTPLYQRGITGAGQVGAVSDSGLSVFDFDGSGTNVPSCYFLDDGNGGQGGAILAPGANHRKVVAYTTPSGATGDAVDATGHGSHVVGSIVGDQAPWGAASSADGQAYEARIYFQDIGTTVLGFINPPSDYRVMFAEAYDPNGDGAYQPGLEPRTHSNSWGSVESIYSIEAGQIDDFIWTHPDYLILFAAGNQGPGPSTIGAPATAKNIVTVGATENGLADPNSMGYFSSHGPVPFGRLAPTVSAPGDRLTSVLAGDPCATTEKTGTSMATPTVHGQALLMRQYLEDGHYPSGSAIAEDSMHPSAALLKALLMNSGRPLDGAHTDNGAGGSWPSNGQGWGRVTVDDALYFPGDQRALWLHDEYALDGSDGFDFAGQSQTFTIEVADGRPFHPEPLEITLAWSDYPGSPLAGGALVNDLDLLVTGPDGTQYRGNDPLSNDFVGLPDLPPAADHVNPWETVYLETPQPGAYTITVSAFNIGSAVLDPVRKQGFALVASGDLLSRQGRAQFEFPAYEAAPADVARLRHSDLDLNQRPDEIETIQGNVSNLATGETLAVTLTETGADTAIFAGQIRLINGSAGSNQLAVHNGDEIRFAVEDADDGRGRQTLAAAAARIEKRPTNFINPPQLNGVANAAGAGSYTLEWSPAEDTERLSHYVVQESMDLALPLVDDAEGPISTFWSTGGYWQADDQYQHSGSFSYWSSDGFTVNLSNAILALESGITLPDTTADARFSFYSRYHNFIFDEGYVEATVDGGASWHTLRRLYADPLLPPQDGRLQYHEFDLSPYLGQTIRVRFRFDVTDGTVPGLSPGWWIDDITISAGTWHKIGITSSSSTSFEITGRVPGYYAYRVRGVYADGSVSGWSNVAESTVTQEPRVNGGGWLQNENGQKINFALSGRPAEDGSLSGQLQFNDKAADAKIKLQEITYLGAVTAACGSITSGPNALELRGTGTYNGTVATFRACAQDGGEPGQGQDRFYLTCQSGCDYQSGQTDDSDVVQGGNVQVQGGTAVDDNGATETAPTVITLGDVLLVEGIPGTLQTFTAKVYDQDQQPLAGVAVTLARLNSDGTVDHFTTETAADGAAQFTVVHLSLSSEYVATAGTLASNRIHINPLLP